MFAPVEQDASAPPVPAQDLEAVKASAIPAPALSRPAALPRTNKRQSLAGLLLLVFGCIGFFAALSMGEAAGAPFVGLLSLFAGLVGIVLLVVGLTKKAKINRAAGFWLRWPLNTWRAADTDHPASARAVLNILVAATGLASSNGNEVALPAIPIEEDRSMPEQSADEVYAALRRSYAERRTDISGKW